MRTCSSLVAALCTTLAVAGPAANASERAQIPHTAAAAAAAGVISRAERAIVDYVTACTSDAQDLNGVLTADARVEFALDEPGTYLSLDASSLAADCAATAHSADAPQISNLWIFPTHEANVVFVQYDVLASTGTLRERQLALVEMRGDRIARMLNLASSLPAMGARAALDQSSK
ncbi:MAG TPA: hypothetical protein VJS12_03370 [Steroidobacteraceae bacterium]|nr:hypothetical protein [Steroidobacteraceae bacterium]